MSTTTFFTFALHALVISGVGWLLVRWGLRDARHRAWAAMVMALSAVLQPVAVNLGRVSLPAEVSEMAPTDMASAWRPEWTVKLAPTRPTMDMTMPVTTEASRFDWRDHLDEALGIWLAGTLVLGLIHAARSWRAWRWRKGLRRGAREGVWVFEGDGGPCVVGLWRPVIAVPTSVHENWTEDQWRWLLAHEGEHVRERDPLTAWLLGWVRACLWWNPFVHALIGHWSQAREEVCDAAAISHSGDHERYASFLVDIASQRSRSFAIAMAASRPASRLRARLVAVLEHRPVREHLGLGFRAVMAVIFATGTFLVSCVGVEQPESPPTGGEVTTTRQPDIQLSTKFVKWDDFVPEIRKRTDAGDTLNEGDVKGLDQRESASITTKSGEVIEFIRVPEARHMVTRAFKVVPDFLVRLAGPGSTARQGIEARGIKFWEGSSAVFNKTTSQLIVKHSPATLQKITALVDQVNQGQTMVFVQSKLIEGPVLLGTDGAVIQDAEVQSMMKSIAQQKGVDLLSAPSITTRLEQEATVEVSKERGQSDDFVGLRIELDPKPGEQGSLKLQSHVIIAHEFTPGSSSLHILSKSADKIDWSKVKRWEHKTTSTLKHGETTVIHVGETQKGRFVTALITAKALLPTGQEAKEFSATMPTSHYADDPFTKKSDSAAVARRKAGADTVKVSEGPTKNVYITAKVVDITSDEDDLWLNFAHDILLAEPAKPGDKRVELPKTEKNVPTPAASSATLNGKPLRVDPGIMALTGVFTDPQFQVIIRALSQKKGVNLLVMPSVNVKPGEIAQMKAGAVECEVTPVIGADGYSIDLLIQYNENPVKNAGANESPDVSTIVTIWDGQTVALGGRLSKDGEKPARHRLIFVTAKLIELSVDAAK